MPPSLVAFVRYESTMLSRFLAEILSLHCGEMLGISSVRFEREEMTGAERRLAGWLFGKSGDGAGRSIIVLLVKV